jgi:hypothetical protein
MSKKIVQNSLFLSLLSFGGLDCPKNIQVQHIKTLAIAIDDGLQFYHQGIFGWVGLGFLVLKNLHKGAKT